MRRLRTQFVIAGCSALTAAIVAVAALAAAYGRSPAIRLEMDRERVPGVSGFFPSERDRTLTFAWMGREAELRFPGLDRRMPWSCSATVAIGVPRGVPLPALRFAADGIEVRTWQVTKIPDVVSFEIPAAPGHSGLIIGIVASSTFEPGPQDVRELGAAFDRLTCEPTGGRFARLPATSTLRAAGAAALLGAAIGAAGLPALAAAGLASLGALAQAWPLAFGVAPYQAGTVPAVPFAAGLALVMVLGLALVDRLRGAAAPVSWRAAAAATVVAVYLKILILLHPSMPIMDALFQAHRLESVLGGRYFFTSLTPDSYHFPYGISLYLAAAPFARIVPDHVALVRLVVVFAEAAAGLLVFAMVARAWSDRRAAFIALALFHATPIAQGVIGTGNLTNAFGESVALAAVAALVLLPTGVPAWLWVVLPAALAAFAFVAHFSTLVVLAATMAAIALSWRLLGEPPLRAVSSRVIASLGLALAISFAAFYGHFWDTYRSQAQRLAGEVRAIASGGAPEAPAAAAASAGPREIRKVRTTVPDRGAAMLRRTRHAFGLLLAGLATAGAAVIAAQRRRDRLSLAAWAWMGVLAAFSALAVLTPLEMRYHLAVAPALAMLAGAAASACWRIRILRMIVVAWLAVLITEGARGWYSWLF